MDIKELDHLNRILGDTLGRTGVGEPIYKWVWSRELKFPVRDSDKWVEINGVHRREVTYKWEYALSPNRPCWVMAKWLAPGSYDEWVKLYGIELAYPQNGLFYTTDIMLVQGE